MKRLRRFIAAFRHTWRYSNVDGLATLPGGEAVKRLMAAGIMPPNCGRFVVTMDPAEPVKITMDLFVSPAQYEDIVDALIANHGANEMQAYLTMRGLEWPHRRTHTTKITVPRS